MFAKTRLRHRHAWKLKFGGKFEFVFLQKYGAAIFFLYGNKNVPSAQILRGRRCLRTTTFILFGLIIIVLNGSFQEFMHM